MLTITSPTIRSFLMEPIKRRAWLLAGVFAYIAAYQLLYITWLSKVYSYYGFEYIVTSYVLVILSWILSLLPAVWSPISLERPSQIIYWVLYFVVFVPSMFIPMYVRLSPVSDIIELMMTLFLGFTILGLVYLLPLPRFRNDVVTARVFWTTLALIVVGLNLWIVFVFRGNFHLVNFGEVYELRSDADLIMGGSRVAYAMTWLAGSINPFLMAYGLDYKKRIFFWLGCGGEIFLYTAAGNKATILVPIMVFAFYLILRSGVSRFASRLSWALTGLLLSLFGVSLILEGSDSVVLNYVLSIFFMRTFGLPGLFSAQYFDFFHSNPLTYFSHVSGFNLLTRYPYDNQLGVVIGRTYSGVIDLNNNAHFWATDGIAGLGLPGILIVSLACALLFWVLDSAANGHRPVFAALALLYGAMNISNASLFTTLFTGGMFLSILFLLFLPKDRPTDVSPA